MEAIEKRWEWAIKIAIGTLVALWIFSSSIYQGTRMLLDREKIAVVHP